MLYFAEGQTFDPYFNLAMEKWLCDHLDGRRILYLWQNEHTVVIGKNQNPLKECRLAALKQDGGLLARRCSGGGAVYHDLGNLNFTFLVREADYSVPRQLEVILHALNALGIPAERSGRNDILADGRKCSGNAFYRSEGRCYHHGTLLVDVDRAAMSRYLTVDPAKLAAKGWDYDGMASQLAEAYRKAALDNRALLADVGGRFYRWPDPRELYAADGVHPSELGSRMAAETIADVIRHHKEAE